MQPPNLQDGDLLLEDELHSHHALRRRRLVVAANEPNLRPLSTTAFRVKLVDCVWRVARASPARADCPDSAARPIFIVSCARARSRGDGGKLQEWSVVGTWDPPLESCDLEQAMVPMWHRRIGRETGAPARRCLPADCAILASTWTVGLRPPDVSAVNRGDRDVVAPVEHGSSASDLPEDAQEVGDVIVRSEPRRGAAQLP